MIWVALGLYVLGMVPMTGWYYETEDVAPLTWRWLALAALWPLLAFVLGADALVNVVAHIRRMRPHD